MDKLKPCGDRELREKIRVLVAKQCAICNAPARPACNGSCCYIGDYIDTLVHRIKQLGYVKSTAEIKDLENKIEVLEKINRDMREVRVELDEVGELKALIVELVSGSDYETEYDGRMESYCFFCGAYRTEDDKHSEGCEYLKAREVVKDIIDIREKERLKKEKKNIYTPPKTRCKICHKGFSNEQSLSNHTRDKHDALCKAVVFKEGK